MHPTSRYAQSARFLATPVGVLSTAAQDDRAAPIALAAGATAAVADRSGGLP
ncbi:hypothetical protein [Nocardia sp. NBC_01388]|uniref:hypothetical protein n=1 Tax=Nocardia sp. NBC_01388 TaxID=2903596 RepID=UPI003250CDEF